MAFAPGRLAFVEIEGVRYTFDAWTFDWNTDSADVSDFDRISSRHLPGLDVGTVTMGGPYYDTGVGILGGHEYEMIFGLTASVGLIVTVLVKSVRYGQAVHGVGRVDISGVVNSDFLNEPTVLLL